MVASGLFEGQRVQGFGLEGLRAWGLGFRV